MKLIKIINARQVLDSFADNNDISAHLSYWMTKFVVKTEADYNFYVSETQKIFKKYAEETDGKLVIPGDKVSDFKSELSVIEDTEAEDPGIRFNLSELSAELKLSMKQMYSLMDFIDENN